MRQVESRLRLVLLSMAAVALFGAFDHALAQAPAAPGPIVAMLEDRPVFFFSVDEEENLMSLHFPLDIDLCGGAAPFNLADIWRSIRLCFMPTFHFLIGRLKQKNSG